MSCSSAPVIQSAKSPRVELKRYQTFQWLTQSQVGQFKLEDPELEYVVGRSVAVTKEPAIEEEVKNLVETDLRKNGFTLTEDEPDFYVTFYTRKKNGDWVSSWSGRTPGLNGVPVVLAPDYSKTMLREYREEKVYITIYDPKTERASWSGSMMGSKTKQNESPSELALAVDKIVENFKKSTS